MKLRRRAQFYLATSVLAAAALQAYCIWAWQTQWQGGGSGPTPPNLSVAALLVGLAVLAQHFPLEAGPRRKVDLAVAVYFAGLLLFGTPVGMALVGGAQLLGQGTLALRRDGATGRQRSTPRAVLFNAAQYVLATGLGGLAYYAFVPQVVPAPLDRIENLWALPCAAAAMYLTNSWLVALMVGLQRGTSPARVWLSGRGADLLQFGALFALGLSMALLATLYPWSLLLLLVPAAILHASLERMLELLAREREARAEADRAVQSREEFISVAAHELKNPLAGLLGYTQLLLRDAQTDREPSVDELRDTLNVIGQQGRRLERLIALLLDSQRIETGKLSLDRSVTDVTKVVSDVVVGARVSARDHQFVVRAPPSLVADVDAIRLEQVLANLVDNALKYSPSDAPIEIELGRVRPPADMPDLPHPPGMRDAPRTPDAPGEQEWMRLTVRDHGGGIPREHREHVFERFYQAESDGQMIGLGLGLYISRRIVEAHGGWIGVESPPDGGSRFVVLLPLQPLQPTGDGAQVHQKDTDYSPIVRPAVIPTG